MTPTLTPRQTRALGVAGLCLSSAFVVAVTFPEAASYAFYALKDALMPGVSFP